MSHPIEKQMQAIAILIDSFLREQNGEKTAFVLTVAAFTDDPNDPAHFVSNIQRPDSVKLLRRVADIIETQEYIPPSKGPKQ